ncbi:MAG: DUF1295 domain-containing protein [Bacilli bacterium]|nr:DUF1295 domain-containing protein [Bacilli bacterium]
MKQNRIISFIIIFITYILALGIGILTFNVNLVNNFFINVFIADIAATIFVFIIGLLFKNASIYDPYWSVAPPVILALSATYFNVINIGTILLFIAIGYWSIRLTLNWAYTFKNLNYQDWRYSMFKEKTKGLYPLVNLFGIHIMPTLVVYFAILPALYYIKNLDYKIYNLIGFIVCIIAATIQLISDIQVHKFRKLATNRSKSIRQGLWKYSRHPNYFGEVLMWWGIYIFCLSSDINSWLLFIGALLNTLLFIFISIPLQEKRLITYKENYKDYMKKTSVLVLWFNK